jgi:amino acid adenylation domain-containing protein
MDSVLELLAQLESLDVRLQLVEGRLRYSAPPGVLTPQWLAQIAAAKEGLLEVLAQRAADRAFDEAPIARQPRTHGLPLSTAQQRFWFTDRLQLGNSASLVMPPIVLELKGALDAQALERSLNALIQRHEVLRSAFRIIDDVPVQLSLIGVELALTRSDLSGLDPTSRGAEWDRIVREEAVTPFELQSGLALMRARLLKLGEGHHGFILTMHHIISDGWSMGILVNELAQLYRAHASGGSARPVDALPPLPIQYADYASWERKRLGGERLRRLRSYWQKQLQDAPTLLNLPLDKPRPRIRTNRGAAEHFQIDAALSERLYSLCNRTGVTPFMALLAALGVLLCRYTDAEDLVIGSPIGVRSHPQADSLIGPFLNTIALRLDLSGNPDFTTLLARVRQCSLDAFEHREMPFEQVLQSLELQRNLDHTPLFQVLFALQNAPMGEIELDGLQILPHPPLSQHSPFDLVLSMEENAEGINGFFRYNLDLFEASTVQRMVGHFCRLLEGLVDAPATPLRLLPLMGAAELDQLALWRGPMAEFPVEQTIHAAFQAQAARGQQAIALHFESEQLRYDELESRANQLAHRLQRLGVQRGERVGLCVERSLELVVGVLGILKAGAAYVPLDPAYPEDRLRYMAQDSALKRVLVYRTQPPLNASLIDLADPSLASESSQPLPEQAAPDDVAYVIYTSGSTGRPKGVEVTHANVLRLLASSDGQFGFGPTDVWTLFHSYAFDFSVWEIWGALLYGGELVVVPAQVTRSPDQFHELLCRHRVSVLNQTPSAFKQLISADARLDGRGRFSLKWVVFGGEALDPRSLASWVERHGLDAPQLINMYGITETTVHVTFQRIEAQQLSEGVSNIGRPLSDLSLELVDRFGQPVPIGVGGEMWVGGAGVAKGYLNLPDLTAQRFVTSPHGRLYRSGDLARWRADGQLEYLGRIDHQVKIRGFRIELGEIESALQTHVQVTEVHVEAREDAAGARLIAYVASPQWQEPSLSLSLRSHLKSRLPDYMLPSVIVPLERLPLTANGKLDRQRLSALLALQNAQASGRPKSTPPQTDIEKRIAALWCEVLGLSQIGLDDNFFELGGDSIRGAILVNKIQQQLHCVVYVVALFEAPTVRQLIDYLRQHYGRAMAQLEGREVADDGMDGLDRVGEADLREFAQLITPVGPLPALTGSRKNPPAVFVLSPPRSGSTLLRVLLGGHPGLFSPPELELLGFDTLGQRRDICSGRDAFWLEGTLRAVMAAQGVDADAAKILMAQREDADVSVQAFYGELQSWIGDRRLVDKSPSYALEEAVLDRAEAYFDGALFIHLHRHPYGMISSFEEARLNQIFFRYPHELPVRRLAELIWLHSHRNIERFLKRVPAHRQMAISFEAISSQPAQSAQRLCEFLGLEYRADMVDIYAGDKKTRMTDGIYRESKMLGDTKFHQHQTIDASVAERWREVYKTDFLGDPSWDMAQALGYERLNGAAPIQAVPRSSSLPLSFAQRRLWFLDQLEGAASAYNMPVALHLRGALDRSALCASLGAIVERHEGLRSRFETADGVPRVLIASNLPPTQVIDLRALEPAPREAELLRRVREDAEQPFDLAHGPLFRSQLLVLAEDEHVVLVNMHHIVSDGWSMGVMVREWSTLYNAIAQGQPSSLAPLPIQYGDYAQWQHRHLVGPGLGRQVAYWRRQLEGAPALLELPTDRVRPAVQRFRGETLDVPFTAELSARVQRHAEQSAASPYMVLLAGFGALLSRYSGQRDILIGSPSANRSRSEVEGLIGFFVNTLVMRVQLAPQQSYAELLTQVRQTALDAYAHQDLPFEQLVEEMRPERKLSHSPLFQVMFSMQNAPSTAPALNGLEVREISARPVVAKYDLTLSVVDQGGILQASFEYNTDLFDRTTIERLASHYLTLMGSLLAAPDERVDRAALLTRQELQRMAGDWNATEMRLEGAQTLHGLFEVQARRTPEAMALQFGDICLSYKELNARADHLASALSAQGLVPGQKVALCVGRGVDLLLGLLAILKSGCAYIPLDPAYPAQRLQYVLSDAQVAMMVTQRSAVPILPTSDYPTYFLDDAPTDAASPAQCAAGPHANSDALAYLIYTSGSTGQPKGVMISHRAAVNFLQTMLQSPGLEAADRLLAVTTVSFDIAVLELFLPLSVGACVVLADEAMARDAHALAQAIDKQSITVMQATPATWRMLLAMGWQGGPGLKILCGGEAMPAGLATQLLPRCAQLWNLYGPTETTVWSAAHRVRAVDLTHANIPIGRPIGNTRLYVLDTEQGLQPIGVAGELVIGGRGLADGYFRRPELSAERFVPDPFVASEKVYRTGDLARYLPDGCIEFLGRSDQQIKLRGFRIELGEIEVLLSRQPGIMACAVAVDRSRDEEGRLVAYYLGEALDSAVLKAALQQDLPDYMVPNLFVRLPALPLTPNGKVDRQALALPQDLAEVPIGQAGFRDGIEMALVQIWEQVLGVSPIGIHDSFFDLGGHSIVAVRLMAQVAQRFGRHLPLASLFQGATVEAMARLLRAQASSADWSSVVPIQPRGDLPALFCAAGAGGNVVYFHELARAMGRHRPFFGLQPPGLDGVTPVLGSVETLARAYLDGIQSDTGEPPAIVAGHSFGGLLAYEMACALGEAGQAPQALVLIDTPAPQFFNPTGANWSHAQWLMQVSAIVGHLYGVDAAVELAQLEGLDDEAQLHLMHQRLMATGVLPQGSALNYLRGFVSVYKANLAASYRPRPLQAATRVLLLRARDEQPAELSPEQFEVVRAAPDLGWQQALGRPIRVVEVPGDHLTMMRAPHVNALADAVNDFLLTPQA